MNEPVTYGHTETGRPITDDLVADFAAEAKAGYDVDKLRRPKRGRPTLGSAVASVESARLDPEQARELAERARQRPPSP